ncbi:MAG TPA: hypothetical protein VFJ09_10825 [Nocardioidaceae bacterium]|nr:hypothetical protein [Nocardioidaceae bacterium]
MSAVDLEHDHGAVRQRPFAVEVPLASVRVPADQLTVGRPQPEPAAHRGDVELAERLRAPADVVNGESHPPLVPHPTDGGERALEISRGAELLLHDRREDPACVARVRLPGTRVDRRTCERRVRKSARHHNVLLAEAARLVHLDPGQSARSRPTGYDDVDQLDLPAEERESADLQRREPSERNRPGIVEQGDPDPLQTRGLEVVRDHTVLSEASPAVRGDLGIHSVLAHAVLGKLLEGGHAGLVAQQPGQ